MNITELDRLIKYFLMTKQKDNLAMFRSIKAKAEANAKEDKKEINDKYITKAIQKEHKELTQTLSSGIPIDSELYAKTKEQIDFLDTYMPTPVSKELLVQIIRTAIEDAVSTDATFGVKMKLAIAAVKDYDVDGKTVSEIVKGL